jgi:hypothetical protein
VRGGDPYEGIPSNQMEATNQMKMVSSHLSVQNLIFFKESERRGSNIPSSQMEARNHFQGKGKEGIH